MLYINVDIYTFFILNNKNNTQILLKLIKGYEQVMKSRNKKPTDTGQKFCLTSNKITITAFGPEQDGISIF